MILEQGKIEGVKTAISNAVDRAHTMGYNDGHDDGYKQGFSEGATSNDEEVYEGGYNAGYADGSQVADEALQNKYEEGYEQGYEQGKSSMIDPDKIIEKTATGKGIVALDDVSEIPHNISVQLSGENFGGKQVTVYGRNLFDNDTSKIKQVTFFGTTTTYNYIGYEIILPKGTYVIHTTLQDGKSGSDYIYGKVVDENKKSVKTVNTFIESNSNASTKAVVFDIKDGYSLLIYNGVASTSLAATQNMFAKYDIQIESDTLTPFESYIAPRTYIADENGKIDIKSFSPNMTIVCEDTDISISISYRADWGIVTEREKMWNGLTINGTRRTFDSAFSYGFSDDSFRPITDLTVTNGSNMFNASRIANLAGIFKKYGTKLNTSKATTLYYAFYNARITRIPEISLEGITSTTGSSYTFCSPNIESIENLIFKEDGTTPIGANMLYDASKLEEIRISGIIGNNINLQWCPLSRASIYNIFDHLKDFAQWTAVELNNSSYGIVQDSETGAYPCDIVKVVLREGLNPADYVVLDRIGEYTGDSGTRENEFDENGVYLVTYLNFAEDNTGFYEIDGVSSKDGHSLPSADFTIYEGKWSSTKTATFSKSAANKAYETSEGANNGTTSYLSDWYETVNAANAKGWTIELK